MGESSLAWNHDDFHAISVAVDMNLEVDYPYDTSPWNSVANGSMKTLSHSADGICNTAP